MILLVAVILAIELFIFAHTQFTLWPEMVLYPWLANHGFSLYRDIINPYFPLLTWGLSGLTRIFGYDTRVFVYFTWTYIFITQICFMVLVQKLFRNNKTTLISFFIFTLLLIIFEGNGLWFDSVCMLSLLFAFYFLVVKKYFWSGLFLSVGLLTKQSVIWAVTGILFFTSAENLLSGSLRINVKHFLWKTLLLLLPVIGALLFLCLFFIRQKTFADFFFWTVKLPFGNLQKTPGFIEFPTRRNIVLMFVTFWPVIVFFPKIMRNKITFLALIFFAATFLFAFPRFGYFHLLPTVMFFAIIVGNHFRTARFLAAVYTIGVILVLLVTINRSMPFSVRFFDKETYALAKKIKKTTNNERFFLQNSPQQIYFMNNSLPPRPWAINFPWYFEKTNLQPRVIEGLKRERIKFVILEKYQQNANPWTPGTYRPLILQDYIDSHYNRGMYLNNNNILMRKK